MSRRTDILSALQTRLEGISQVAGYQTDAGAAVFSWLSYRLSPSTFPMLTWRDAQRTVSADDDAACIGDEVHTLSFEVEGVTYCDDAITELRALLEDVRKAVAVDVTWSGKAIGTDNWQDTLTVEETEEGLLGFCRVTFDIIYRLPYMTD